MRNIKGLTKEEIIKLLLIVVEGKRSSIIFDSANSRNVIKVCNKAKTSFITKYHRNGSLTVTLKK